MRRKEQHEILDEYLVLRGQGGDREAMRSLVDLLHPRLVAHAWHLTGDRNAADDVVQEAWLAIVRGLRRLRDPARFRSWALKIVTFKCRDWIRRAQSGRRLEEGLARDAELQSQSVDGPQTDSSVARRDDRPQVFNQMCIACHSLDGQGGVVGPALDGVGARLDGDYIKRWLADPYAIKPNSLMPKLPLSESDIVELVAFLSQLKD